MNKKMLSLIAIALVFGLSAAEAEASRLRPMLHPGMLQACLLAAGIDAETVPAEPQSGYEASLYIPYFKGSCVLIGFPASGIGRGTPFFLEIDGIAASVRLLQTGLALVNGDERITAQGIFGTLECILREIIDMLDGIFDSILELDFLGVLEYSVGGILGVVICIIY